MKKKFITTTILIISVLFICVGINKKQYEDIKNKAILICLECIGIG